MGRFVVPGLDAGAQCKFGVGFSPVARTSRVLDAADLLDVIGRRHYVLCDDGRSG